MPVRVVTDTSAGLPEHVARDLGITVLDLHMVGDEDDKSTSGLSSLELAAAYARQLERGGDAGVVALHLSKDLSATWSAAVAASAVFDGSVAVSNARSRSEDTILMMFLLVRKSAAAAACSNPTGLSLVLRWPCIRRVAL